MPAIIIFVHTVVILALYLYVRLHKCTEVLLAALVNREVCSKSSLMEIWKEDKKCKYSPYNKKGYYLNVLVSSHMSQVIMSS